MSEVLVITDASILIALEQIEHLGLLPGLFDTLVAPPAVVAEFGSCPDWLRVVEVQDHRLVAEHLARFLDEGEAEAIAVAREHPGATLLLDERRGRRFAQTHGFTVIGTAGILVQAKHAGLVTEVRPLLDRLRRGGFRLSEQIYIRTLLLAGETPPAATS